MVGMHMDLNQSLEMRLAEFRSDPEKMKCVSDFIDELLERAQKDAEVRRNNNSKQKRKTVRVYFQTLNASHLIALY